MLPALFEQLRFGQVPGNKPSLSLCLSLFLSLNTVLHKFLSKRAPRVTTGYTSMRIVCHLVKQDHILLFVASFHGVFDPSHRRMTVWIKCVLRMLPSMRPLFEQLRFGHVSRNELTHMIIFQRSFILLLCIQSLSGQTSDMIPLTGRRQELTVFGCGGMSISFERLFLGPVWHNEENMIEL